MESRVPGVEGGAVQFYGTGSITTDIDLYRAPGGFQDRTVSAWVRATGPGTIVSWGQISGPAGGRWTVGVNATGYLTVEVEGGSITAAGAGATNLFDGEWHHIATVLSNDGSANVSEVALYVDGSIEPTTASPQQISTIPLVPLTIGTDSPDHFFVGAIDELRIENFARTPSTIGELLHPPNREASLWHRRHFGEDPIDWSARDDADPFNRLGELAYGGNPWIPETEIGPALRREIGASHPTFYYFLPDGTPDAVIREIQTSGNLIDWNPVNAGEVDVVPVSGGVEVRWLVLPGPFRFIGVDLRLPESP